MPRRIVLPASVDEQDFALINAWQRDFPLDSRPFAHIAAAHQLTESDILLRYRRLIAAGVISRVGPVFAPNSLGASALVALAAPPAELEEVALRVSSETAVNHNYEREHRYNLWFVVTASDRTQLAATVAGIASDTGCPVLTLPLEEEFHIDLGFDLSTVAGKLGAPGAGGLSQPVSFSAADRPQLSPAERELARRLQSGLELVAQPFAALATALDTSEGFILGCLERWLESGILRRFGVVVRHHELGLAANAMCVWDVPDDQVSALGRALAAEPAVTLCYRRRRVLPGWPYNLFCMIHGHARDEVLAAREEICRRHGLEALRQDVLFSRRRFKQTGARYLVDKETADV
ncbi:MAG: Lrp/AsnC family transcriptional regulator [Thauera sp.]|jgi:DNA-binding Lrp family transcriptional regulator|nr:Lrp/AsnC family transcriptional regulator [Thauera sp.]